MIQADQPTCFDDTVVAKVSSQADGQMQLGWKESDEVVIENRKRFLAASGLAIDALTLVRVKYHDEATYDLIRVADQSWRGAGAFSHDKVLPADCLVTTTPGVALFLPIADCVGTVVHDPRQGVLALAHLGRHSSVAKVPTKLVTFLEQQYQSKPEDLIVWMAPSIKGQHYLLERADFAADDPDWRGFCQEAEGGFLLDLQGYNTQLFSKSGVPKQAVHVSPVNTATDREYWSHYTERTIKGRNAPPRFAVVCALR